ncbi:hypothetical protein KPATCC21470_6468 [Kitasatospora purpeofusca]
MATGMGEPSSVKGDTSGRAVASSEEGDLHMRRAPSRLLPNRRRGGTI